MLFFYTRISSVTQIRQVLVAGTSEQLGIQVAEVEIKMILPI
jgi:hypothetical protein